MTEVSGTSFALTAAQVSRLQGAGVSDATLDLIGRVHTRMEGAPDIPVPPPTDEPSGEPTGDVPVSPDGPPAPPPAAGSVEPWVDTIDPDYPQLARSHVYILRAVGLSEQRLATLAASNPHPVDVEEYIQQTIIADPDGFDQQLAAESGEDRPIGTTRAALEKIPAAILQRPDPNRLTIDEPFVDSPHPDFPNLAQSHVQLLTILGYDGEGIANVSAQDMHPAELDQMLNQIIDNPEGFDSREGLQAGTTRQRLIEAGILPADGTSGSGPADPGMLGGLLPDWAKPVGILAGIGGTILGFKYLRGRGGGAGGGGGLRGLLGRRGGDAMEAGIENAQRGRGMYSQINPVDLRAATGAASGGGPSSLGADADAVVMRLANAGVVDADVARLALHADDVDDGVDPVIRAMANTTGSGTPSADMAAIYDQSARASGGAAFVTPGMGRGGGGAMNDAMIRAAGLDGTTTMRIRPGGMPGLPGSGMDTSIPAVFSGSGVNLESAVALAELAGRDVAWAIEQSARAAGGAAT